MRDLHGHAHDCQLDASQKFLLDNCTNFEGNIDVYFGLSRTSMATGPRQTQLTTFHVKPWRHSAFLDDFICFHDVLFHKGRRSSLTVFYAWTAVVPHDHTNKGQIHALLGTCCCAFKLIDWNSSNSSSRNTAGGLLHHILSFSSCGLLRFVPFSQKFLSKKPPKILFFFFFLNTSRE